MLFEQSPLLGYLNHKTKAASRGSKSRGSFGNHYAIYVLVEDYLSQGFGPGGARAGTYESYEGLASPTCSDGSANCRLAGSCRTTR